ncbi:MAG: hypothetical protein NG747_03455 [Candidatus Brocadia sp.]|nr:hypothetical protein [Candidatus Brocadia sp.]
MDNFIPKGNIESPSLFDEGFPGRVFRTSVLLSLILIAGSLSYMSYILTISLAIGCFTSITLFKTTLWAIQYAVRHKREKIKGFFLKISFLKYFIIGTMLLSACLFLEINVVAMSLGLSIVVTVIIMKVGSRLFVNYLNKSIKVPKY